MGIRVIVPDSHGAFIDKPAARAFLDDLSRFDAEELILLGDHVDCAGVWTKHPRAFIADKLYSYEADLEAADEFLDEIQERAPHASIYYLEGNHEHHIERWASENVDHIRDVMGFVKAHAPEYRLRLKERGIRYFKREKRYMGLPFPNLIKLGKCLFTHGFAHGVNATRTHVLTYGYNVVHGHTHTESSASHPTIQGEMSGWCPGTLAQRQPIYAHNTPTRWTHGYAFQSVLPSGLFQHVNVRISRGQSLLTPLMKLLRV